MLLPAGISGTVPIVTATPQIVNNLDDLGNAQLFLAKFGKAVRFCPELGAWLVWNGRRWQNDQPGLWRMVATIARLRYRDALRPGPFVTLAGEAVAHENLWAWARKTASKSRLQAMLDIAAKMDTAVVAAEDLDADLFTLNTPSGTLDLLTGELRAHRKEDLLTQMTEAPYDPAAACPTWDRFVDEITCGDKELTEYLQESCGYSLCGAIREQVLFLLVGKGANGKSTFLDAIFHCLGSYAKSTPAHTFVKSESRAIRNDIARLMGARFVTAVEINTGRKLDEALVKRLTGGDPIVTRFLRREYFEFVPQAKFWLAVNVHPEVSGADDGIYRRVRVVPFNAAFKPSEMDKGLPAKLKAEAPGILAWAVRGFQRWRDRGFLLEPPAVTQASSDYRAQMDITGAFITDCCAVSPEETVPVGGLFDAYLGWCRINALEPMKKKTFGVLVRQKGFTQGKSGGARFWRGLGLSLSLPSLQVASQHPAPAQDQVQ